MPTSKHHDIAALIAAAATMGAHGEPVSMAVKETIGRAECARLGRNPDVTWSGHLTETPMPYWRKVADDAIAAYWSAEQTRRNLLVPAEIHARLETLERTLGLGGLGSTPSRNAEFGYKAAWDVSNMSLKDRQKLLDQIQKSIDRAKKSGPRNQHQKKRWSLPGWLDLGFLSF